MATDIFPTTLAALGYKIEEIARFGQTFSDKNTLAEEYGVEELDERFLDRSHFYEDKFMPTTSVTDDKSLPRSIFELSFDFTVTA